MEKKVEKILNKLAEIFKLPKNSGGYKILEAAFNETLQINQKNNPHPLPEPLLELTNQPTKQNFKLNQEKKDAIINFLSKLTGQEGQLIEVAPNSQLHSTLMNELKEDYNENKLQEKCQYDNCENKAAFFHSRCCGAHFEGKIDNNKYTIICEKCGHFVAKLETPNT